MSEHPTDHDLERFARHRLPPDRVLLVDDHLAICAECRTRAAELGGITSATAALRTDVLALDMHLSDDELQEFVGGGGALDVRARVERHLQECTTCASQVQDLQRLAAARSGTAAAYVLAVAAAGLLLAISALALPLWIDREGPDSATSLAGLDALSVGDRARVQAAIDAGVVELPASLTALMNGSETLMGTGTGQPFQLVAPLATITVTDRPVFRWQALSGAEEYTVAVFSETLEPVAGPVRVTSTDWTPPDPLARGRVYLWQVTATRGTETFTAPAPPAPPARFRVMDADTAAALTDVAGREPDAHVLLGILFAQAGARQQSERHLLQVPATDPHADLTRRTLERLRTGNR